MTNKKNAAPSIKAGTLDETAFKQNLYNNTVSQNVCQSAAEQRRRILSWLCKGSLTTLEARRYLDVLHPAGRIMELRKQGHPIETIWTVELSDAGGYHRIAQYMLQQSKEEEV